MVLEFHDDAISLSGPTGTKLKSEIINSYYKFWWEVVSGGPNKNYRFPSSIIELNAATGEIYIEETDETVLGSAGHALELKASQSPKTRNLRIILIEENDHCFEKLEKVIERRF